MADQILQYQKASKARRLRRWGLLAIVVTVGIAAVVMARGRLVAMMGQLAYVRLQSRCVKPWTQERFVAFTEVEGEVSSLMSLPQRNYGEVKMAFSDGCGLGFGKPSIPNAGYRAANLMRLIEAPPTVIEPATIYMGWRKTPHGEDRLVWLHGSVRDTRGKTRRLSIGGSVWEPASYSIGSRVRQIGVVNQSLSLDLAARVRIMSGQAVPGTDDAMIVELISGPTAWKFEAKLLDDGDEPIAWRLLDGPPDIVKKDGIW